MRRFEDEYELLHESAGQCQLARPRGCSGAVVSVQRVRTPAEADAIAKVAGGLLRVFHEPDHLVLIFQHQWGAALQSRAAWRGIRRPIPERRAPHRACEEWRPSVSRTCVAVKRRCGGVRGANRPQFRVGWNIV